jgi:hypothetical protein
MTVSVPQAHSADRVQPAFTPIHPVKIPPIKIPPKIIEAHGELAPADWRLTGRGIALVMLLAVTILAAALVVIGTTAVRVTSVDHGAASSNSRVDRR